MKYLLYIIFILFASCADDKISSLMDEADRIFDTNPEESLTIMQSIDTNLLSGELLSPGREQREQHARYGLLYTKACYKNYIDAENDSLIFASANYYEDHGSDEDKFYAYLFLGFVQIELMQYEKASHSLMKAMAHTDAIDSYFYKGQLYSHLAKINSSFHCSDEEMYARRAYIEYKKGGFDIYVANAMAQLAQAKYHAHDFDSCRIWADSSLIISSLYKDTATIVDGIKMKINACLEDNCVCEADSLYHLLFSKYRLKASSQDLSRLSIIATRKNNRDDALRFLNLSAIYRNSYNDSVVYYATAYKVYKDFKDYDKVILYQDSLLYYEDRFLKEALQHTALAAQRDYASYKLNKSEFLRTKMNIIFIFSFIVFLFILFCVIIYLKKQKLQVKLREETIKNLQDKLLHYSEEVNKGVNALKFTDIFSLVDNKRIKNIRLNNEEWKLLENSFREHLPSFENTLTNLYPIKENEWRICMLLKLGYSPSDLCVLTDKSSSNISLLRSRLYKKLLGKEGNPSDLDKFILSI